MSRVPTSAVILLVHLLVLGSCEGALHAVVQKYIENLILQFQQRNGKFISAIQFDSMS